MAPHSRIMRMRFRARERGQVMILTVFLISVGIGAGLLAMTSPVSVALSNKQAQHDAAVLAQAKEALIGRSASDASRPGSLPCPDAITNIVGTNVPNDGIADLFAGNDCPSYIGRLPWRTLGLPDLRDSSGERLWYALSNNFRDDTSAQPINNDTKGNRIVYSESTALTLTPAAVALVFAPGPALTGQVRDAATALCPTTSTTIARNLCAANYLNAKGGADNAQAGGAGPFIAALASSTFNDRVLVITTSDLMTMVEQRVAREMLKLLSAYRAASACACYPWAANDFDDDSVDGRTQGGVPIEVAKPEAWGLGTIPAAPTWLATNKWGDKFYYAVAPTAPTLTVNSVSKNVVLITTGPAGASRPNTNLADYVDDVENRNLDNIFQTPSSTAYARDRLYTLP
jgi:hypothetical protein